MNLRISGVAICLFRGKDEVMICEENRVVLSYAEQTELGSKQPYMVSKNIVDRNGASMNPHFVGRLIHMRKNKRNHSTDATISNEAALQEYHAANENYSKFSLSGRHFQHVVLRERVHTGEAHQDALSRLLREEFLREFKVGAPSQHDFIYQREPDSNALLVYLIREDNTVSSNDILQKRGVSNYFCAKKIVEICDNDYNETRNHQFVTSSEARKKLLNFSQSFPPDVYDTSQWGALDLFNASLRHWQSKSSEATDGTKSTTDGEQLNCESCNYVIAENVTICSAGCQKVYCEDCVQRCGMCKSKYCQDCYESESGKSKWKYTGDTAMCTDCFTEVGHCDY